MLEDNSSAAKNKENILAKTNYGIDFPSIVNKENIYGLQFHPESILTQYGHKMLHNFLQQRLDS